MKIYGIDVELEEPDNGSMVMDVMVIARQVSFDSDGHPEDSTLVSTSRNTTGIIQQGMVSDIGIHLAAGNEE